MSRYELTRILKTVLKIDTNVLIDIANGVSGSGLPSEVERTESGRRAIGC